MKKINFEMPNFDGSDNSAMIEALKTNENVLQLLKKYQCSVDMIEKYPHKFNKWLVEKKKCEGCQGLAMCRQSTEGQYMDLEYDGLWMSVVRLCTYKIQNEDNLQHMKNYLVCDLPKSFYTIKLNKESFSDADMDSDTLENLSSVLSWLKSNQDRGMYLYGPVGTGKSYLSACVANSFARDGKSVAYVNVPEWINRMKSYFNHTDEMTRELSRIKRADFVVFDDIGAESVTSWVRDELLFPILNHRMENKKKTWFTSNENFESLENHFKNTKGNHEEQVKAIRIMERIKTLAKPQKIMGKNRRNQK